MKNGKLSKKWKCKKSRLLSENAFYERFDCLINHIPKPVKNSTSNSKEKL